MYKDIIPSQDNIMTLEHEGHSYILHVGQWTEGGEPVNRQNCDLNSFVRVTKPVFEAVRGAQQFKGGDAAAWRAWENPSKEFIDREHIDRLGALDEIDSLLKESWGKIEKTEARLGENK